MRPFMLARTEAAARSSERGGALVMALVSVVTVAALTTAFLHLSTAVSRRQVHTRDKMQAFYLAEAGLAEAWAAVQIRKTGNVGTEADPAIYGDGLFWVEASAAGLDFVRLDSTGLVGSGRATLSLVVEEGKESVAALGVYSDSPMTLPPGSFVDGYDSRLGYGEDGAIAPLDLDALLDDFSDQLDGLLGDGSDAHGASAAVQSGGLLDDVGEVLDPVLDPLLGGDDGDAFSGRIASGGGITVSGTPELPSTIQGDLVPGPGGQVSLSGDVSVSGETAPAPAPTSLPDIHVPSLPVSPSIQHSGRAPFIVLPGEGSLPALEVAEYAEVIVRGPATLVIGTLRLRSNAKLYVDATDGPVSLYVTAVADLAPTAKIRSSTEDPADLSLTITASPQTPIVLPKGSPIHAVVYAPDAELSIPEGFELFGALVAQSVTFAGPPRLHFDAHLVEVAAEARKPRLISWRILDLGNEIDAAGGPFARLGLDPAALRAPAAAHADVPLSITFENGVGALVDYDGMESGFDWGQVAEVLNLSRDGRLVVGTRAPAAGSEASGLLDALIDVIEQVGMSSSDLRDVLVASSPLSKVAISSAIQRVPAMTSSHLRDVLLANVPLSDSILARVSTGVLGSTHLMEVLLAQSPGLSSTVLDRAAAALAPSDLAAVLAAQ